MLNAVFRKGCMQNRNALFAVWYRYRWPRVQLGHLEVKTSTGSTDTVPVTVQDHLHPALHRISLQLTYLLTPWSSPSSEANWFCS